MEWRGEAGVRGDIHFCDSSFIPTAGEWRRMNWPWLINVNVCCAGEGEDPELAGKAATLPTRLPLSRGERTKESQRMRVEHGARGWYGASRLL